MSRENDRKQAKQMQKQLKEMTKAQLIEYVKSIEGTINTQRETLIEMQKTSFNTTIIDVEFANLGFKRHQQAEEQLKFERVWTHETKEYAYSIMLDKVSGTIQFATLDIKSGQIAQVPFASNFKLNKIIDLATEVFLIGSITYKYNGEMLKEEKAPKPKEPSKESN